MIVETLVAWSSIVLILTPAYLAALVWAHGD